MPVIICIILGLLVGLLLALLARQMQSARARHRGRSWLSGAWDAALTSSNKQCRAQWRGSSWRSEGRSGRRRLGKHSRVSSLSPDSRRSGEPFSEAVYKEIEYSPVREKKMRYSFSGGSCFECSLTKLQPYLGKWEEEDLVTAITALLSLTDIPVLPGDSPVEGYDDAGEVSEPGEPPVPGQGDWPVPRGQEEAEGPRDAAGGEREMQCCSLLGAVPGAAVRATAHGLRNFPQEVSRGERDWENGLNVPRRRKVMGQPGGAPCGANSCLCCWQERVCAPGEVPGPPKWMETPHLCPVGARATTTLTRRLCHNPIAHTGCDSRALGCELWDKRLCPCHEVGCRHKGEVGAAGRAVSARSSFHRGVRNSHAVLPRFVPLLLCCASVLVPNKPL